MTRVARHDMGWLGRSTIVSPSAHRPSMEELGLHDGKPAPGCEIRIGRLARSRSVGAAPDLGHTGHVRR